MATAKNFTDSAFNAKQAGVSQTGVKKTPPAPAPATSGGNAKKGDTFVDPAGRSGTVGFDTKTGLPLKEGQTTSIDTSKGGKLLPSIINTSSLSRSNYSENVNNLSVANNNIRQVQQGQTASGIAASLGMTPENFLKLNPNFGAPGAGGTKGDYKGLNGTIQPGMTYKIGPDGTPNPVKDEPKPDANGNIVTEDTDGTTSTTDKTGKTIITNSNGDLIDPTIKKLLTDNIIELSSASANAKTIMDNAAATLNDNPAAQAAAANIKAQYDILIRQMEEKNRLLMGSYGKNAARSGMLQYANEMDSNFKSMELDKGVQRIADLVQQENNAILKSNAAYKSGDVKAFDAASKDYQASLKEKQNAIMDLNKAINDAVKENDTQIKQIKADEKQAITDDIRVSAALGKTMAEAIANSGIKDEATIEKYVQAMAEANGINNPNILKNSLVKEQQAAQALALKNTNTASIIANRGKTKTGVNGKVKITISDGIAAVTPQMKAVQGADKYVSPENWLKAREKWNEAGLTDASFNTTFKKYLNPASYPLAGFKAPKATAGTGFK